LNGSPHMDEGNTGLILTAFLDGMRSAGADIESFCTRKLSIMPCLGDLDCWMKTPGECSIKDDMQILYPKFREADVVVYASPVYCAGITGPLKNLIDRLVPLYIPGQPVSDQLAVLISTCGAWELEAFSPLLVQMGAIFREHLAGSLLRPHAEMMKPMLAGPGRERAEAVIAAAREAGRQMAAVGRIAKEVLEDVGRELGSKEEFEKAFMEWMEGMKKAAEEKDR